VDAARLQYTGQAAIPDLGVYYYKVGDLVEIAFGAAAGSVAGETAGAIGGEAVSGATNAALPEAANAVRQAGSPPSCSGQEKGC
jgi:hypothetical protein